MKPRGVVALSIGSLNKLQGPTQIKVRNLCSSLLFYASSLLPFNWFSPFPAVLFIFLVLSQISSSQVVDSIRHPHPQPPLESCCVLGFNGG